MILFFVLTSTVIAKGFHIKVRRSLKRLKKYFLKTPGKHPRLNATYTGLFSIQRSTILESFQDRKKKFIEQFTVLIQNGQEFDVYSPFPSS